MPVPAGEGAHPAGTCRGTSWSFRGVNPLMVFSARGSRLLLLTRSSPSARYLGTWFSLRFEHFVCFWRKSFSAWSCPAAGRLRCSSRHRSRPLCQPLSLSGAEPEHQHVPSGERFAE